MLQINWTERNKVKELTIIVLDKTEEENLEKK